MSRSDPNFEPVSKLILKFKQQYSRLTMLPLIGEVDHRLVEEMEKAAPCDAYYRSILKTIRTHLKSLSIENIQAQRQIMNAYCEARIYMELKPLVFIERNPETTEKQPDFRWEYEGEAVFAEIKTLSMAGSDANYKQVIEEALDSQIKIEEQINQGRRVAFGETVIQPAYVDGKPYDPYSRKMVIERLLEKIGSLIKPGQFKRGSTILIVDLNQWAIGQGATEALLPFFTDHSSSTGSGVLWNIAFGGIGYMIMRHAEFEGKSSVEGILEREGLLLQHPEITGLIFRSGWNKPSYYGLLREDSPEPVVMSMNRICSHVNDDGNTEEWRILREARR